MSDIFFFENVTLEGKKKISPGGQCIIMVKKKKKKQRQQEH